MRKKNESYMFDFTLLLFDNSLIVEDCYKKGEIEHVF